jgi:hypothetical protein
MDHSGFVAEPTASEPGRRVVDERLGFLRLIWRLGALDGTATGVELQIAERSQGAQTQGRNPIGAGHCLPDVHENARAPSPLRNAFWLG